MQQLMQAPRRQGQGIVSAPEQPAAQWEALGEAPCYSHPTGIHSGVPNDIETQMLMIPCLVQCQQLGISFCHGHS